ncbi:metalloregulator ArsR/SmtB family transcription factor [Gordonia jinghuaiqii]|uniref:Helix-turn-helix transcriptional regulator n=1 Tax=Gordonia jinghuaiqii TaxID=2758710 RepID=A0A7D7LYX2_9ACTN|nr:metalloregulator ArsR/SmtB family transcription factor [Gordonia jinghuaiqii]QMT03675.1 helix-turn-helix transcriptional regulator [Gordonia jinghuaiqii]
MPDVVPVEVFGALADESRWQILTRLGAEPASASTLATELPISRQAIAKHLRVLTEAGLVTASRSGREIRYEAVGGHLSRVARQLVRSHSDEIATGRDQTPCGRRLIARVPLPAEQLVHAQRARASVEVTPRFAGRPSCLRDRPSRGSRR